ncbi:FAD:protein FMN transferase [Flexivirga alba]|uniref:FAD:protein FMN transferase n=1 Tax=Flexivirga alba TaxID=702742 RepID=A0ABW2AGK1_9MICO
MGRQQAVLAAQFTAIGTSCRVLVTDRFASLRAAEIAMHDVAALDLAASRFRADSELCRLPNNDLPHRVSPLLGDVTEAALRTAALSEGLVDPTVGATLAALGYDADLDEVRARGDRPVGTSPAPTTWRSIRYDAALRLIAVPVGCVLDFGASAKAFLADRIAARITRETGSGVLVDLGGDIATAGAVPSPGWRIGVEGGSGDVLQTVIGGGQAFATSSTALRTWTSGGVRRHHIVDPRTGAPADAVWEQVTVAGSTALEANSASTAAIVLGADAAGWLAERGLPALLIGPGGARRHTPGWPEAGVA